MVDVADAADLGEESVDEAEVAAGDAGDGRDGDAAGEVVFVVAGEAVVVPAAGEDGGELVGPAISLAVIAGLSRTSPAATTRTACTSSLGGESLSMKPLAPACSPSYT